MEFIVTGRFRVAGTLDDSPSVWLIGVTVEQSGGEAMEPGTYFLSCGHRNQGTPRGTTVNVTQAEKKSDGALRLNPRSSTSSFLSGVIGACLAVLLWGVDAGAQDEVATLLNLSPWQSYVHLFCDKTGGADCAVTFRCGQQSGAPVTWPVEVEPSRIFTYWPNKTDGFGRPAGLEAALVNAGLTSTEARRRTTCTVRSDDPVEARAYTFFAGEFTPVANVIPRAGDDNKVATLLNLSPWQSYVHLFCDKTGGADCAVTFRCGQQSGAPVTWPVEVEPSRIFTYWPNKTDGFGRPAGLEAALVNAGLTSTEARRRTTCTVRSDDPVKARAYTFLAGYLVPVANVNTVASDGPRQPGSTNVALSDLIVSTEQIRYGVSDTTNHVTLVPPFDSNTTSYAAATVSHDVDKVYITAVVAESDGISGIIQVNGYSTISGASSEAITLTAGRTTTISIVVSATEGLTRKIYTVTVTRQEDSGTPPSRSGGGAIRFEITDGCDDGYVIRYGFYEYSRTSLTNSQTSLVRRHSYHMNGSFGTTEIQHITCTVGNRVCLGAESSEQTQWGVGFGRHRSCSDCCWTCPRIRPGWGGIPDTFIRRRLTCPGR